MKYLVNEESLIKSVSKTNDSSVRQKSYGQVIKINDITIMNVNFAAFQQKSIMIRKSYSNIFRQLLFTFVFGNKYGISLSV